MNSNNRDSSYDIPHKDCFGDGNISTLVIDRPYKWRPNIWYLGFCGFVELGIGDEFSIRLDIGGLESLVLWDLGAGLYHISTDDVVDRSLAFSFLCVLYLSLFLCHGIYSDVPLSEHGAVLNIWNEQNWRDAHKRGKSKMISNPG